MAFSNFTLETVQKEFQLEFVERAGIFAEIEPVTPSELLTTLLAKKVPLATTINTEKARSELIVADVLSELWEQFERRISLFSGIEFNVDAEIGLTGMIASNYLSQSLHKSLSCNSTSPICQRELRCLL